ncbi:efflux RND transporter permease subunit [Luteococcus sp. OSA5]|uniref:efflux RND transporter permease subunit n=1 Tax=Luteococcus sp. OSA5 TaxID=3401630 RepID=UPI003B431E41
MDSLAKVSLKNRALIALITVFVTVFGGLTASGLKQELIPSLEIPSAFIMTSYPGASPQVVEERVTGPIEQAVLSLQGLEGYTSTSATGMSTVTVNVEYGSQMAQVQQELQASVSRIKGTLPEEADAQVFTGSFDDMPVQVLAVTGDGTPEELAQRLQTIAIPEMEKLPGVRQVTMSGARAQQVQVTLDDKKLAAAGLSRAQVQQAIAASGGLVSGGSLKDGKQDLAVTVGERHDSAQKVSKIALVGQAASPGGAGGAGGAAGQAPRPVTLGDVATVKQADAPATSISRTNGKPSLSLAITKTPDRSTVEVSEAINEALPGIAAAMGSNPEFTTVFDQAPFITQSIHDMLVEGGLGLLMAVLVILAFLRSLRSTLVTAVSIPTSILLTLIGLRVGGYSLNILTLGALTMAIGRVVDDSIVVVENIKRHLSYGVPKMQAILVGVREVATAITAATITTVAVFLPIGLVGGQTGELFRPFAFTMTMALMGSLLVALTIVPVLSYWFLEDPDEGVEPAAVEERAHEKERRSLLQRTYLPALGWALRHRWLSVLLAVALLAGSVALGSTLKTDFLGNAGMNTLTVQQQFPPALTLQEQGARASQVEKALLDVDGVETVQTTIGGSGIEAMFSGAGAGSASFSVTTDEEADQQALAQQVRDAMEPLHKTGVITVSANQGMGGGDVEVVLTAPDSATLKKANDQLLEALRTVPDTSNVASSLAADQPQVQVQVDQVKAARLGLDEQSVGQAVRGILQPQPVAKVEQPGGHTIDLVLQAKEVPEGLDEMRAMPLMTTPTGQVVKLSDIATVERTSVATEVDHTDGQRSVTISLTPTGDNLSATTSAVTQKLDEVQLPAGADAQLGGVATEQDDAFRQLGLALLAAIAIVYVVMVATFKSLVQPLILTISIPFAAVGAIVALLVTDTALGVPAMIGLLMLVGIVVTNAIVLIDLVNHYRERGDGVEQALVEGSRQRLRPIIMTALATIFAMVPMGLGLSGGGVFISKPLAIVVIGGLLSSTLLTLLLVPVLYHLVESGIVKRREQKAARRTQRRQRREEVAAVAVEVDQHGNPVEQVSVPRRSVE